MRNVELQGIVLEALGAADKPLTEAKALEISLRALKDAGASKEAGDFTRWFDSNGKYLTERVNCG